MIDGDERTGASVDRAEGVPARGDLLLRLRRVRRRSASDDARAQSRGIVEKPPPEDAPSNLAVMGRYVFTPDDLRALERVQPGVGGEIQLTDAIALLLEREPCTAACSTDGRYDIGKKLDYLRATVELALDARGPRARVPRRSWSTSSSARRLHVIPLEEARALRPRPAARAAAPDGAAAGRRARAASPSVPVDVARGRAAVRQHGDGRLRRAGRRHVGASAATPVRLEVAGLLAAGAAPDHRRSAPGEAMRIMTGAPMPDGADAVVMVEDTEAGDDDDVVVRREVAPAGDARARGRRRRRAGDVVFEPRHRARRPATSACWPASGVARGAGVPAAAGRRAVDRRRAGRRRRAARARARSASRNRDDAARAGRRRPAASRRPRPRPRRRGRASTAAFGEARRDVRRAGHQRRGEHGRLRLREGRARPRSATCAGCRSRSSRPSRSPSGSSVDGARPVFGLPGNPVSSLVSLRAVRPARRCAG